MHTAKNICTPSERISGKATVISLGVSIRWSPDFCFTSSLIMNVFFCQIYVTSNAIQKVQIFPCRATCLFCKEGDSADVPHPGHCSKLCCRKQHMQSTAVEITGREPTSVLIPLPIPEKDVQEVWPLSRVRRDGIFMKTWGWSHTLWGCD